jgi:hypothetical protein
MQSLGSPQSSVLTMFDENLARIRAHRNNILRYRRLLPTRLTDVEQAFIDRRMPEEQAGLDALVAETFPVAFTTPTAVTGATGAPMSEGRT